MNLFFKSYGVHLIFFLLITCKTGIIPGFSQADEIQLTPWIEEVVLPSTYRELANETFYRDNDGTLYIGKGNGLQIIDGKQINFLYLEGPVYVNGNGSDTLFYVSTNDLGFLVRDRSGTYGTISRIHLLPASKRTFRPTGIEKAPGHMLIQTETASIRFSASEVKYLDNSDAWMDKPDPDTLAYKRLLNTLSEKTGIPADEFRQVFTWNDREIWVLGAHTLHRLHDPSPLSLLETGTARTGRILASETLEDQILLGTTTGLFRLSELPDRAGFWSLSDLLPGSRQAIPHISADNGRVFAAGPEGLYSVSVSGAQLLDSGPCTAIIAAGDGSVVASGREGIIRYYSGRYGWESSELSRSLSYANSFTRHSDQIFFLCNNEVYVINSRLEKIDPVPFQPDEALYRLIQVKQDLYLVGAQQVYQYDPGEGIFLPLADGRMTGLLANSDIILPAGSDNFLVLQKGEHSRSRVLNISDLDEALDSLAGIPVLSTLGELVDMSYADSVAILTGTDKISFFDLRRLKGGQGPVSAALAVASMGSHTPGIHITGFEWQNLPDPLFRYRILPSNGTWTGWSSSRDYSLPRLKHGEHVLEVQAADLFGRISQSEPLAFAVPTPLYATWYAFLLYGFMSLLIVFLIRKWRLLGFRRAESRIAERMENRFRNLAAEKEKSDKLVEEILPAETARQLKSKGKARWDKYDRATVLFSDIQGFTRIAEEMNPEKLIDELDTFFFHFDSVVEKYNIEKIKTIGDAYMAAGGIPHKNSTNPVEVVMAALEMQAYMQQLKSTSAEIWDLRIGIHTGPVIAGVVGHKKISYDIWGDTVNTASRMESSGTPGKINISGITYGLVKDYFLCEYRGKLPVKYKGNIDMYYVNGLRPELSIDLKGIPNKRFYLQLQLLRLSDLEEKVFGDIISRLPGSLHFHGPEYARRVYNQSFLLCRSEEIDQEGRLLVKTAALMLFTGLSQQYFNFENRSAVVCREVLPGFQYTEQQIDQICNLILATKAPFNPNNRLEKILIDARMEYIGRPDYSAQAKLLFRELKEAGAKINGQQFKKQQLEMLFGFDFYSTAAKRLREVSADDQVTTLEQERWI